MYHCASEASPSCVECKIASISIRRPRHPTLSSPLLLRRGGGYCGVRVVYRLLGKEASKRDPGAWIFFNGTGVQTCRLYFNLQSRPAHIPSVLSLYLLFSTTRRPPTWHSGSISLHQCGLPYNTYTSNRKIIKSCRI